MNTGWVRNAALLGVLGLMCAEKLRVLKDWKHTFAGVSQLGV